MYKLVLSFLILLGAQGAQAGLLDVLPTLNVINSATLTGSRLCGEDGSDWGLFVTDASIVYAVPELVLMHMCDRPIMISGDYGSATLIADMGIIPIEDVNMNMAMAPAMGAGISHSFRKSAYIEPKHTYSAVIQNQITNALIVFTVDSVVDKQVKIRYAVRSYTRILDYRESEFQSWAGGNVAEPPNTLN